MIKVLGLGDNVVDKYMHIKTMYPGGNALNIAVLARLSGIEVGYLGVFGDVRQRNMFIKQFQIWELTFHTADSTMVRMAMQR